MSSAAAAAEVLIRRHRPEGTPAHRWSSLSRSEMRAAGLTELLLTEAFATSLAAGKLVVARREMGIVARRKEFTISLLDTGGGVIDRATSRDPHGLLSRAFAMPGRSTRPRSSPTARGWWPNSTPAESDAPTQHCPFAVRA